MFDMDLQILLWPLAILAENGPPPLPGEADPTPANGEGDQPAAQQPGGLPNILFIFLLIVLAMIIFSMFSQRKEKKRREEMINSVKKHDKVQTIGGVIGSIVEVKPDTVILKVDESSNTRITISRAAIQQVLKGSGESPNNKETQES